MTQPLVHSLTKLEVASEAATLRREKANTLIRALSKTFFEHSKAQWSIILFLL
jgi:hypothetical protein